MMVNSYVAATHRTQTDIMAIGNRPDTVAISEETVKRVGVTVTFVGGFLLFVAAGGWLVEYAIESVLVMMLSLSETRAVSVEEFKIYPYGAIRSLAGTACLLILGGVGSYAFAEFRIGDTAG
jgi:hypothetical protein